METFVLSDQNEGHPPARSPPRCCDDQPGCWESGSKGRTPAPHLQARCGAHCFGGLHYLTSRESIQYGGAWPHGSLFSCQILSVIKAFSQLPNSLTAANLNGGSEECSVLCFPLHTKEDGFSSGLLVSVCL